MPVYYAEMTRSPENYPSVYEHFQDGGCSVQIGDHNPFGRIPVDETIEETVNKDTQIGGGNKGFSLKPGAISKYFLIAEYISTCLKNLCDMIEFLYQPC